jgi:hypothetical protein
MVATIAARKATQYAKKIAEIVRENSLWQEPAVVNAIGDAAYAVFTMMCSAKEAEKIVNKSWDIINSERAQKLLNEKKLKLQTKDNK